MEEKRHYPRTSLETSVKLKGDKQGKTKDVSLSGLRFLTNEQMIKGSRLDLTFFIQNIGSLKISGQVMWSRGSQLYFFDTGLKFEKLTEESKLLLSHYINSQLNTELERRKFRRLLIDVRVNYSYNAKATTKNVNEEGMCLYTKTPIKNGDFVVTTIQLPAGDEVTAHSKVVWNKKIQDGIHENGIRFWNIEAAEKQKLLQYIRILSSSSN